MSSQYLPVAAASGSNVDSQGDFAGSGYQQLGFTSGIVLSKNMNKCLRQSSMVAAAVAQFIANQLGINVNDDGNLTNLVTNLTAAILQSGAYLLVNQRAPVMVNGNTITYQNLIGVGLGEGLLNATGRVIRITGFGAFTTCGSAEQINLDCVLAGASIGLGTPTITGIVATVGWRTVMEVQTIVPGTSGELFVSSSSVVSSAGGSISQSTAAGSQYITGVDLTGFLGPQWQVAFGVASASNSCTQYGALVEVLQ